ncbi:hypothetical protein GOBAR_AA32805 [Gossypium barbadense]|uniref:Laccase n=1 Tax=Gossypium barbadense TaxID=3634 RepID=A0A2P5W9V0_GOSBA|nr:hypothetical protein GOBAR_AA32805 [Gossypium barbadense]
MIGSDPYPLPQSMQYCLALPQGIGYPIGQLIFDEVVKHAEKFESSYPATLYSEIALPNIICYLIPGPNIAVFGFILALPLVSLPADAAVKVPGSDVDGMVSRAPPFTLDDGDRSLSLMFNKLASITMSIHWHGLKQFPPMGWGRWTQLRSPQMPYTTLAYKGPFPFSSATENEPKVGDDLNKVNKEHWGCHPHHPLTTPMDRWAPTEIDAVYTKPFTTQAILIAPGQTTNVLVQANQAPGRYFMAARPFMDAPLTVDNKTATAILQYKGIPNTVLPILPKLPLPNDTAFALSYNAKIRSLNSPLYPANVPLKVDRRLFYTIGLGINPCPTCLNGTRLSASLNNITFVMPHIGLLQAHYFNIKGVYTVDFPDRPPQPFNYTGAPLTANLGTTLGTRLSKIAFNSTVELVLQDTNLQTVESHPFHLHGYNFFVVGTGIGNFDPAKDPSKFNLVDPPERNTVGVPTGVWFMHCHLELHTGWGLKTAFVVENGKGPDQSILPPPKDLPPC